MRFSYFILNLLVKFVTKLNSIGEEFLNGCLVCKIERKIFENVSNDAIIDRFQNMKSRRVQL